MIKIPNLICIKCGHQWIPRQVIIKQCPKCKTTYWNKQKGADKIGEEKT